MVRSFQNLLVSLNPTSGQRLWWLVYAIGMILIFGWVIVALPWIDLFTGSLLGVGRYGSDVLNTTMIAYGHEIPDRMADYYFLGVLFGIAIAKLGLLLVQVAGQFARGWQYLPSGILGGGWVKLSVHIF